MVQDGNGEYAYAKLSPDKKTLVPSDEKVGKSSPKHPMLKDLRPHKNNEYDEDDDNDGIVLDGESAVAVRTRLKRRKRCNRGGGGSCGKANVDIPFSATTHYEQDGFDTSSSDILGDHHRRTATTGTLKNLVILLKFKDHEKRTVPSKKDIAVLMNSEDVEENLAPTGSLKMIYRNNSYGQLTIESEVTDWITLNNTEKYYAGGESGVGETFHEALKYALDELEADKRFKFENFDLNQDGNIDSISFLTSGYGAEWGQSKNDSPPLTTTAFEFDNYETWVHSYCILSSNMSSFCFEFPLIYILFCIVFEEDSSGAKTEDRIWSHKWRISGGWESNESKVRVTTYFVSPSLWGISGEDIGRVGVIAHGTFLLLTR